MKITRAFTPLSLTVALGLGGCASVADMTKGTDDAASASADETSCCKQLAELENLLASKESELATAQQENQKLSAMAGSSAGGDGLALPPNAKAGECYARVLIPAEYSTAEKQVLESAESETVDVVPATYETVEEKVLVKEAGEEAVLVPAKYEDVIEKVLVSDASEKLVTKPAVYKTETEEVVVKPAYTAWKKGRGPIEKIDNSTGEIMCLIEVPAETKTISRRVMVEPPRTEKLAIPAEYKEVKKRVMVEPPKMVKKEIPAEYKTVKVRKMVTPPQEKRTPIPAKYTTITERSKVSDERMEWRSILCETNTNSGVIADIQRALGAKGYNPGPIDGVIGSQTTQAMSAFQRDNNMASGQITLETLKALGVR